MHAVCLCVPLSGPDPELRVILSAQCPVSWSHGSQPGATLLGPEFTVPQKRAEGQAQEALRVAVLASVLDVFS